MGDMNGGSKIIPLPPYCQTCQSQSMSDELPPICRILPKVALPTERPRGLKSIDANLVLVGSQLGVPPVGEHQITQPTHNPPKQKRQSSI